MGGIRMSRADVRILFGWDATGHRVELTRFDFAPKFDALSTLESEFRTARNFELLPPARSLVRASDLTSADGLTVASGEQLAQFYGDESQPLPGVYTL